MTAEAFQGLTTPPEITALGEPDRVFSGSLRESAFRELMLKGTGPLVPYFAMGLMAFGLLILGIGVIGLAADLPRSVFLVFLCMAVFFFGGGVFYYLKHEKEKANAQPEDGPNLDVTCAVYTTAIAVYRDEKWQVVRCDEIAEFYGVGLNYPKIRMVLLDGSEVHLEGLSRMTELSKDIEERAFYPVMHRAQATLDGGGSLKFGVFTLDKSGLTLKDKHMPWQQIGVIQIGALANTGGIAGAAQEMHAQVIIRERGKLFGIGMPWCAEPFMLLPNRTVLLRLLQTLRPPDSKFEPTPALGIFLPAMF